MTTNAQFTYLSMQIGKIQDILRKLLPGGRLPGAGQPTVKNTLDRRVVANEIRLADLIMKVDALKQAAENSKFIAGPATELFDIPVGSTRLTVSLMGGGGSGTTNTCGECGQVISSRVMSLAASTKQIVLVAGAGGTVNGGVHSVGGVSSVELIMKDNSRHYISASGGKSGTLMSVPHASEYGAGGAVNSAGTAGYVEIVWN
jgi:hypothetical protein